MIAIVSSRVVLAAALTLAVSSAPLVANQNWSQWRGPLANGIAPEANPPTIWSETQNIKWKVAIPGNGSATPIVWGSQIFVQTAVNTGRRVEGAAAQQPATNGGRGGGQAPSELHQFVLLCLDRSTGKTLWQKVAREAVPHEGHHADHGFSSSSPTTDGLHVYAFFGSRGLYCYDLQGNLKWEKDFGDQQTRNGFGEGSSPTLHGNILFVNWDHEGADDFLVALDKATGKELWRQAREERTTWTTPFVVETGGRTEVVVSGSNKVRSYDPATGKLLWETSGLGDNAIPMPVTGHGLIYATTGYTRPALLAIRAGKTGDLSGSDAIAWKLDRGTPYVASPLLYGDWLYLFRSRDAMLSCHDAKTGQAHYAEERLSDLNGVYASPVGAAGRIYLIGRNGATLVIKQSDKLEKLATNKLDEGIDASPALVGNELFLRGRNHLYCIAEK